MRPHTRPQNRGRHLALAERGRPAAGMIQHLSILGFVRVRAYRFDVRVGPTAVAFGRRWRFIRHHRCSFSR